MKDFFKSNVCTYLVKNRTADSKVKKNFVKFCIIPSSNSRIEVQFAVAKIFCYGYLKLLLSKLIFEIHSAHVTNRIEPTQNTSFFSITTTVFQTQSSQSITSAPPWLAVENQYSNPLNSPFSLTLLLLVS